MQKSTICCNFANGMLRTLRTYLFTALLMLAATAAAAADKTPFYIIDGQLGMRYEDMPPQEDILYITVMDSAEAVFVYGERAAGGAVVVQTKEYARQQNYRPPIRQTDADNEQYDGPIQLSDSQALALRREREKIRREKLEKQKESRNERIRRLNERSRRRRARSALIVLICAILDYIYNKRKKKDLGPLTDEQYREVIDGLDTPVVPDEQIARGIDPLLAEAAMYVVSTRRAGISDLQQFFGIDYQRALKIIEQLRERNVVAAADGPDKRDILIEDTADLNPMMEEMGVKWTKKAT